MVQSTMNNFDDDKCLRCGKCCVIFNGRIWVPCRWLQKNKDGTTYCNIYNVRLHEPLGYGFYCGYREHLPYDIPGCPYNTGKPIHPFYKEIDISTAKESSQLEYVRRCHR